MDGGKADIISRLQRTILPLQGLRKVSHNLCVDVGLGPLRYSFPNYIFPTAAIHEFSCRCREDVTASCGFIAGILSSLMRHDGVSLWISSYRTIFPPALKAFDVDPGKFIFIDVRREKDVLWAMEEALKCDSLKTVVGEMHDLSFTDSRKLQLAVEQSRVTGFILRHNQYKPNITACVTRWKITHLPSASLSDMPGVGLPRWNVELLKVRNGKPGAWQLEWAAGKFHHASNSTPAMQESQKKTG